VVVVIYAIRAILVCLFKVNVRIVLPCIQQEILIVLIQQFMIKNAQVMYLPLPIMVTMVVLEHQLLIMVMEVQILEDRMVIIMVEVILIKVTKIARIPQINNLKVLQD
jgi:hypothetical protein